MSINTEYGELAKVLTWNFQPIRSFKQAGEQVLIDTSFDCLQQFLGKDHDP